MSEVNQHGERDTINQTIIIEIYILCATVQNVSTHFKENYKKLLYC